MLRVPHDPRWAAWCTEEELAPIAHFPAPRWPGIWSGRGCTRWYLAQLLDRPKAAVPLRRPSPQERPFLDPTGLPARWQHLDFNRADVGACTWIALHAGGRIGLDVEALPPRDDLADIFPGVAPAVALERWLAYEAWCKATGDGIGFVACAPPAGWTITRFVPADGHLGAIATRAPVAAIRVLEVRCPG